MGRHLGVRTGPNVRTQNRQDGDLTTPCPKCGTGRQWVLRSVNGWPAWHRPCPKCRPEIERLSRLKTKNAAQKRFEVKRARLRRTDPAYRAYLMWKAARERARIKGLEFSLTQERVRSGVVHGACEATGMQFTLDLPDGRVQALSPTIDRIDNAKGYTDDNAAVVCWIYNRAKADGTHAEVMMLVEALAPRLRRRAA